MGCSKRIEKIGQKSGKKDITEPGTKYHVDGYRYLLESKITDNPR